MFIGYMVVLRNQENDVFSVSGTVYDSLWEARIEQQDFPQSEIIRMETVS